MSIMNVKEEISFIFELLLFIVIKYRGCCKYSTLNTACLYRSKVPPPQRQNKDLAKAQKHLDSLQSLID